MGCLCSQPKPGSDETKAQTEANRRINMEIQKDKHLYRSTHRLLLLGESCLPFNCHNLFGLLLCVDGPFCQ